MSRTSASRRRLKARLISIQRNRCGSCGGTMHDWPWHGPFYPTLEHVWPRVRSGTITGNAIVTHHRCNGAKGDRPPTGCELVTLEMVNARLGAETYRPDGRMTPLRAGEYDLEMG